MTATLVFCRDPAAAVQILGLRADPHARRVLGAAMGCADVLAEARYVARQPALDMLRREGLAVRDYDGVLEHGTAAGVLEREAVGRVVTGTSDLDEAGDVELWRAARRAGLPSLALLDRADNFAARFAKDAGAPVLPDLVSVADEAMREACLAARLPEASLIVGGDLRRAHVADMARRLPGDSTVATRRGWGADDDTYCVLYVSECGREATAAGRTPRFDEIRAFEGLLAWVAETSFARAVAGGRAPLVVVRPHPRDTAGKYDAWIGGNVRLDRTDRSAIPSLVAADLVAGLETSALEEALWLGTSSLCLATSLMEDLNP